MRNGHFDQFFLTNFEFSSTIIGKVSNLSGRFSGGINSQSDNSKNVYCTGYKFLTERTCIA